MTLRMNTFKLLEFYVLTWQSHFKPPAAFIYLSFFVFKFHAGFHNFLLQVQIISYLNMSLNSSPHDLFPINRAEKRRKKACCVVTFCSNLNHKFYEKLLNATNKQDNFQSTKPSLSYNNSYEYCIWIQTAIELLAAIY